MFLPKESTDTKWWKSWQLWLNVGVMVAEGAQYVAGTNFLPPYITIPLLAASNLALRILKTKGRLVK